MQLHELSENGLEQAVLIKTDPSSRMVPIVGEKMFKDITLCNFISQDRILIKMTRFDKWCHICHRWLIKNTDGTVVEISSSLRKLLESADWTKLVTDVLENGTTRLLLCAEKGSWAHILIDWQSSEVLDSYSGTVNLSNYPSVPMTGECLMQHHWNDCWDEKDGEKIPRHKMKYAIMGLPLSNDPTQNNWPQIVLNNQLVDGPDGLYYVGYGSTDDNKVNVGG